jgi:hypothetical protein
VRFVKILLTLAAFVGIVVAFQMTKKLPDASDLQDVPPWKPLPADHWPQEPDGFNGMKFNATRAETEKVIKLESCEIGIYGNLYCKTSVVVDGKPFKADILFGIPHDPKTGAVIGEGRLSNFYVKFPKADYAFVKTAFIKMFGTPHKTSYHFPEEKDSEFLDWFGNKTPIRMNVLREDGAFVIEPNWRPMGDVKVGMSLTVRRSPKE